MRAVLPADFQGELMAVDRETYELRKCEELGLLAKHPDLKPREILARCGLVVVPCPCGGVLLFCDGWILEAAKR